MNRGQKSSHKGYSGGIHRSKEQEQQIKINGPAQFQFLSLHVQTQLTRQSSR